MYYFAITVEYGDEKKTLQRKAIKYLTWFRYGCFIKAGFTHLTSFSSLVESKHIMMGVGETPVEALTDCLKRVLFTFSDKNEVDWMVAEWGVPPKSLFWLRDFEGLSPENAAVLCLNLLKNNLIEIAGCQVN